MFHAVETSEHFARKHKMFEHKCISILNVCELKQENANNQCRIFTFYSWSWIWKYKLWDFVSPSPATPTPRLYSDYSKPPDFQCLPSTKRPTSGRKPNSYQPRAQIKQMFQEGKLKEGDKKAIEEFSGKSIALEKLVADYIDHLTDIELRKNKRSTDNDKKRAERSSRNTMTLTGKIFITESSCHSLE